MEKNTVTVTHTAFAQCRGGGLDAVAELRPGPGGIAPDDRRPVGEAPSGLDQQGGQIRGGDQSRGQRSGSRMLT
jgi:hypothetical protein